MVTVPSFYANAQTAISLSDWDRSLGLSAEVNNSILENRAQPMAELRSFGVTSADVLDMIEITSLNRTENQNRTLYPVSHLNQSDTEGADDWLVFDYIWKENPSHQDIEAVMGFKAGAEGLVFEVNKLTELGVQVQIANQTYEIPETMVGTVSPGFLQTNLQLTRIDDQAMKPSQHSEVHPLHWLFPAAQDYTK